jgi:hypothetical protein
MITFINYLDFSVINSNVPEPNTTLPFFPASGPLYIDGIFYVEQPNNPVGIHTRVHALSIHHQPKRN